MPVTLPVPLAAYAAVLSAGAVAGLVLGGAVVTADLFGTGWRPVFAINVPIGIALAVAVPRLVPPDETSSAETSPGRTRKLDLAGLAGPGPLCSSAPAPAS